MCENKGFTLIELLVVVLIIGILSAVALPQYTAAVEKSRAMEAVTLVRSLRDAQNIYYMANGSYSPDLEGLDLSFNGATGTEFKTKNFQYSLDEIANSARAHVWGHRINSPLSYYIISYLAEQKICCLARKTVAADNNFCKKFTSSPETAAIEPGYNCYEIK